MKRTLKDRFEEKIFYSPDGCWYWTGGMVNAYGSFSVDRHIHILSHRFSYELYVELIPKGINVLHKCDNPLCVNPDHLFLGTHLDNMRDKVMKGRQPTHEGDTNPNSKLTTEEVIEIIKLKGMVRPIDVMDKYDIARCTVHEIWNGKTWKHITNRYSTAYDENI